MSVVAYRRYDDRIEIAADSLALKGQRKSNNYIKLHNPMQDIVIGFTGHPCFQEWIMNSIDFSELVKFKTSNDIFLYIKDFVNTTYYASEWKGFEESILLFVEDKIYYLYFSNKNDDNDNFIQSMDDQQFAAIGSAGDHVEGAMMVGLSPKEAIEICCEYCYEIGMPIIKYVIYTE
jgi:ATP-dependent protease HslVU (ClpYQ) peptidase subunit